LTGFRISASVGPLLLFDLEIGRWMRGDESEEPHEIPIEFGFATPCEAPEAEDPVFREL